MRQKIIVMVMALAVAVLALPVPATAASVLAGGQTHYYSVQMRSDKQAIVYAKLLFEAQGGDSQMTYSFELPRGVTLENLAVQQILAKHTPASCKLYETQDEWRRRQGVAYSSESAYLQGRACLTYEDGDYDLDYDFVKNTSSVNNEYYYPAYYQIRDKQFAYKDVTASANGQKYTLTLPEPIKPSKQGALLVSYTSNSYVSGGLLGRYEYDFRTFLSSQLIDSATVAINFDQELFSRDAQQKRTTNTSAATIQDGGNTPGNMAYTSRSIDDRQLGMAGGQIVKTQSRLLPSDVLSVKGTFATNRIMLYGNELAVAFVVLVAMVGAFWYYRRWRRAHPRPITRASVAAPSRLEGLAQRVMPDHPADPGLWQMVKLSLLSIVAAALVTGVMVYVLVMSAGASFGLAVTALVSIGILNMLILIVIPTLIMMQHRLRLTIMWALIHSLVVFVAAIVIWAIVSAYSGLPDGPYYPM